MLLLPPVPATADWWHQLNERTARSSEPDTKYIYDPEPANPFRNLWWQLIVAWMRPAIIVLLLVNAGLRRGHTQVDEITAWRLSKNALLLSYCASFFFGRVSFWAEMLLTFCAFTGFLMTLHYACVRLRAKGRAALGRITLSLLLGVGLLLYCRYIMMTLFCIFALLERLVD